MKESRANNLVSATFLYGSQTRREVTFIAVFISMKTRREGGRMSYAVGQLVCQAEAMIMLSLIYMMSRVEPQRESLHSLVRIA